MEVEVDVVVGVVEVDVVVEVVDMKNKGKVQIIV